MQFWFLNRPQKWWLGTALIIFTNRFWSAQLFCGRKWAGPCMGNKKGMSQQTPISQSNWMKTTPTPECSPFRLGEGIVRIKKKKTKLWAFCRLFSQDCFTVRKVCWESFQESQTERNEFIDFLYLKTNRSNEVVTEFIYVYFKQIYGNKLFCENNKRYCPNLHNNIANAY